MFPAGAPGPRLNPDSKTQKLIIIQGFGLRVLDFTIRVLLNGVEVAVFRSNVDNAIRV